MITGALTTQLFVPSVREKTIFTALLLSQTGLAWGIQSLGVGSAALFFLSGLPLYLAMVLNSLVASDPDVSLWTYALGQVIPLSTGVQLSYEVLNVFVPLVRVQHFSCMS